MKTRIFEAFAGYGSQSLALKRLSRDCGLEYEVVGYSEIDKYAIAAYNALHPGAKNYGDVTSIDWENVPDFDLLTWSSPCQSVSMAGRLGGMDEGSGAASAIIWSIKDCLAVKKPKYILVENVANIAGKRFIGKFNEFQNLLETFGYICHSQIMNSKDYGVAQNRRRLFLVARRADMPVYVFPEPFKLNVKVTDYLEKCVDESYYLSEDRVKKMDLKILGTDTKVLGWTRDKKGNVLSRHPVEVANCVTAGKRDNTQNYVIEQIFLNGSGDCASTVTCAHHFSGNITNPKGGHKEMGVLEYGDYFFAVRRLTERELFRIMDVEEVDIDILMSSGVSKTQLAKMAGNSIVVSCLYHIFKNMFLENNNGANKQQKMF